MVNQLLTELESVGQEEVIVIGATNRLEDVDEAIRRSGRFDERIEVPPPDADARRAILSVHLADRPTATDLSLEETVVQTAGYAASDLEQLTAEAAHRAMRESREITEEDLHIAVDATETSIEDWVGRYGFLTEETNETGAVVEPEGVESLSATTVVDREVKTTFDDVGGMAELKRTLQRKVLDPLTDPDRFAEYGLDQTSGVLLFGPPGCGKTYVTRALAGELGYYFIEISPAQLTGTVMGEPAQRVSELFAIARANQPCIVFIDEIDAVAGPRSDSDTDSIQQMVNQLLLELEDIADADVVVVGATNLVEDVDGAIRRSGRFDERIEVPPPDVDARREILQVHLADRPTADSVDWTAVAEATAGYAASDLALVADEASHRALRDAGDVTTERLLDAVDRTESSLRHWNSRDRYEESEMTSGMRYIQ